MPLPSLPALMTAAFAAFAAPAVAASLPQATADEPATRNAPGQAPDQQTLTPPPDDTELGNFVAAFVRLVGVQHGYMVMMQNEADPSKVEEMKRHAMEDMTNAVQSQGMTIERYNAIATALESDPGLQNRVEAILRQMAAAPDDDNAE